MTRLDPHSYADDAQPNTTRMTLRWWVDILRSEIRGTATLQLDRPASGTLDLDTRDLTIEAITDGSGQSIRFELADPDPVLGQRLRLAVVSDIVHIQYRTSPNASALQWLTPAQTTGGRHPFVFTQCQAIHARSIVPCQDTPRVRVRFSATVDVPKPLHAVMAAAATGQSDGEDGRSVFTFDMPQPIPPYLLAFAAGDLASADVGPRSRVYAEPDVIDAAAWEFADIDAHLERAEALFGPYEWDRFDMLVMPASFPYGGMENPRLTFLTPTLLAGDRSLVSVVAHELAHSWTG
ncbi:MAG: M1 family aminopeptidase/hydrolase, partial [Planctomycetota bacterium]